MKLCHKCGEARPVADFYAHPTNSGGLTHRCKPCYALYSRARLERDPKKFRAQKRAGLLSSRYGITAEEYDVMASRQGHVCAICHKPNGTKPLFVDHDHTTGAARALLCTKCNSALGMMDDVPDRLRAAAAYLEFHQSTHDGNED